MGDPGNAEGTEKAPAAAPIRALGRSLGDFGALFPAEQELADRCRLGEGLAVSERPPEEISERNRVRAAFIRFLALGGDEATPVHETGVRLANAWVEGPLDLVNAKLERGLELRGCRIESVNASNAEVKFLSLSGCRVLAGIEGHGLRCEGDIMFDKGFHATGTVDLLDARIGGSLYCQDGRFEPPKGFALAFDRAAISGAVMLKGGFRAAGGTRCLMARIGGDLDCSGGSFVGSTKAPALAFDRASVGGDVFMGAGFHSLGEVRLVGADLAGSLDCTAGTFDNGTGGEFQKDPPPPPALGCDYSSVSGSVRLKGELDSMGVMHAFAAAGEVRLLGMTIGGDLECQLCVFKNPNRTAILCDRTTVNGTFFFRGILAFEGYLVLSLTRVATLWDEPQSWEGVRGRLVLDGFRYERFNGEDRTPAATRIAWLDLQLPIDLGDGFKAQPWEQAIAVLRAMGYPDDAREVAIATQTRLRRAGKVVRGARTLHWMYGALVGYGYRPIRILGAILVVWWLYVALYGMAANPPPGAPRLLEPADPGTVPCLAARSEGSCPAAQVDYSSFSPWVYSADVLIPVIDLGYGDSWRPRLNDENGRPLFWGRRLRELLWLEIVLGWLFGAAVAAMLGSLIKKD